MIFYEILKFFILNDLKAWSSAIGQNFFKKPSSFLLPHLILIISTTENAYPIIRGRESTWVKIQLLYKQIDRNPY